MRPLGTVFFILLIVGLLVLWWFKFEHFPPRVSLVTPLTVLGRKTPFDIDVHVDNPGLRSAAVQLIVNQKPIQLLSAAYPPGAVWGSDATIDQRLHVEADLAQMKVPEGPASIELFLETYAWHFRAPHGSSLSVPVTVDMTPPRLELLTTEHTVRLGGADLAVFRQSPDTTRSGIEVGNYFFPALTGFFADRSVALAVFAVPQDLSPDVRPRLVANDAAHNTREVMLPCTIKPQQFAERTLSIDDDFLSHKVPELERANNLEPAPDLVAGYLALNRDLRRRNEAQLRDLTTRIRGELLWEGAFHRQSSSAALSGFADRRSYTYHGEVIDHQTHLGFDLASLKRSPVEAAQNGIVVFADNLGIYGNAVIMDHGLGVYSLYGHLSTISVRPGEQVRRGQPLGQTGETGLAGGDHLHFSILVDGVHVDPVEWWDAHWLHDRILAKLTMFPRASKEPVRPVSLRATPVPSAGPSEPEHEQANP